MVLLSLALGLASGAWAGTVSPLVKISPGTRPPLSLTAELVAARGECQATQIVVPPPRGQVSARIERPTGESATSTPALPLALYREAYVRVDHPSNLEGATGLWPDPLIPVRDAYAGEARSALPADSTPERPLVLYAEICVPPQAPAGRYTNAAILSSPGVEDQRVTVTMKVLGFTLPPTSSLPNSFGLSLYSVARGHHLAPESPEAHALLLSYGRSALAHRVSLHGLSMTPPPVHFEGGAARVDFSEYDRDVGPLLDGTALPSGARFTTAQLLLPRAVTTDAEKAAYARAVREHFQERNWEATPFFYAKDEPSPKDYPLVLAQAVPVHQAGGVPVLVTSPFAESLVPAADLFCSPFNCFFPREGAGTCRPVFTREQFRRRLGPAEVWWYQSCLAHGCSGVTGSARIDRSFTGWASYMIDAPGPLNRAMGTLAFANGIDGELYFDTVYAFNGGRAWNDLYAFGGNGDGTLFYPGTPDQIGGLRHVPIESLRLKHIRDGLQDYEYLRLLERRGQGNFARESARTLARSGYEIERDPAVWEHVHRALAERLAETGLRKTSSQ